MGYISNTDYDFLLLYGSVLVVSFLLLFRCSLLHIIIEPVRINHREHLSLRGIMHVDPASMKVIVQGGKSFSILSVVVPFPPGIVDLVLAGKMVEMDVPIEDGFFGENRGVHNFDGPVNEVVPFGVVGVDFRRIDVTRQCTSSLALDADGSKTRVALLLEHVLGLTAGSVGFRVVDLVDVPIGTSGAARESDGPGNVGIFGVVVGKGQLIESQILVLLGSLVFFEIIFRGIIFPFIIVVRCLCFVEFLFGGQLFVFFHGINGISANFFLFTGLCIIAIVVFTFFPIGLWSGLNNVWTVEIEMSSFQ